MSYVRGISEADQNDPVKNKEGFTKSDDDEGIVNVYFLFLLDFLKVSDKKNDGVICGMSKITEESFI